MERIAEYEKLTGAELNNAKIVLADEATRLLHGEECLHGIHLAVQSLFSSPSDATASGSGDQLDSLVKISLTHEDFTNGQISVVDLLFKSGLATSKNAARRLIIQGGAQVNGVKVENDSTTVSTENFDAQGRLKLSGSKKKHVVIQYPI